MPGLPLYRKITAPSPEPGDADLHRYGPLTLNRATRILTGPNNWVRLSAGEFAVLHLLMQPRLVTGAELMAAAFPAGRPQPRRSGHALAMRMVRLRTTLEAVGVDPAVLECRYGVGYALGTGGDATRVYSGLQLRQLDRLLLTHPDRKAVRDLEGRPSA